MFPQRRGTIPEGAPLGFARCGGETWLEEGFLHDGFVLATFVPRFELLHAESRLPGEVEEPIVGEGAAVGRLLVLVEQVVVIPKVALLLGCACGLRRVH